MTDTSRDPETEADSFDPSRGGYNVTWERYCALLTRAETAERTLQDERNAQWEMIEGAWKERAETAEARLAEADEWAEALFDAAEQTHKDGGAELHRLIRTRPTIAKIKGDTDDR